MFATPVPTFIRASVAVLAMGLALVPQTSFAFENLVFTVKGDDGETQGALEAASLLVAADAEAKADPRDVLAAARADYGRLLMALYGEGYYSGVINILIDGREAAGFSPFEAPARIDTIRINVDPGERFRFGTARVAPLPKNAAMVAEFRSGEVARSTVVLEAAQQAVSDWRDLGRAKASIASENIVADHRTSTLDADITLRPGPIVRFGQLVQTTKSAVRPERIQRIAGLPEGRRFSPQVMDETAERLRRTGAFRSVALTESETLGPGNTMDIGLAVIDEKPRRFGFGLEMSTLEGAAVSGYWMHRNLLGGAERLRFDATVSGIDGTIPGMDATATARLDMPAAFTTDTDAYVLLEAEYYDDPGYRLMQGGGEVGVHRWFSRRLEGDAGIAYHYAITEDDLGSRRFSYVSLPTLITWDRRDNTLDPTRGTFLLGELEPFYEMNGDTLGARAWLDARAYYGVADDRVIFAARGQVGYVTGGGLREVPTDFLFYSGGADTVRGFPYQSLGVDLGGGDMVGGHAFVGGSAEVRFKATDKIGLVAFADVGHVGARSFFDFSGDWQIGAGAGLRYDTGIGPIRLDVGMPVSGPGANGPQIYLGIGQAF